MNTAPNHPETKISATFLEFADPLLDDAMTPKEVETSLQLAYTVWNAVVCDAVDAGADFVSQIRQQMRGAPEAPLVEIMIARKRDLFGHDLRLIGEYALIENDGQWRLRVEARMRDAVRASPFD